MAVKKRKVSGKKNKKESIIDEVEDFVKEEIFHRIEENYHIPFLSKSSLKYYVKVLVLGLLMFGAFYYWNVYLKVSDSRSINKAFANTALVLMGLSFMVKPLTVKWGFYNRFLAYRKYLGVIGLCFGLLHFFWSFLRVPSQYLFADWSDFFFGISSIAIFVLMFILSNGPSIRIVGGVRWRRILSWGYYAIIFAFVHMFIKSWESWQAWIGSLSSGLTLPPESLIVVLFGIKLFIVRSYFFTFRKIESAEA